MRVADYVAKTVADYGVKHLFLVTGGGAMHLNDAFACESRITPIFNHHEQACAIAAEGYARVTNNLAVINVTTGPGGLNALNGVFGAYTDSIPMLIISGQVKTETLRTRHPELNLRQLGDQEVDIVAVARPITKYAVQITDANQIQYELEKCIHLATSGRPGPVWIDIPVDLQGAVFDFSKQCKYVHEDDVLNDNLDEQISMVIEKLKLARRPTIVVGNGVRLSGGLEKFYQIAEILKVPVCPAWMMDFIHDDFPYFCGIQGTIGDRAGNFTVQNSDFVLILGSRLQIRQVSYNWEKFAREAYKVHVDIDRGELDKPTMRTQFKIQADLNVFFDRFLLKIKDHRQPSAHMEWLSWALDRRKAFNPVVLDRHRTTSGKINPYYFFEKLSGFLNSNVNIVAGNAAACVMSFPTIRIHKGQRIFTNAGCASMGYDLPAAFGASIAAPDKTTVCLAGDGSIMMNLQELQTIAQYRPNLKVIVINNDGYLSIRSTQGGFFGRLYGESSKSGVSLPNFKKVAEAFEIKSFDLQKIDEIESVLGSFLRWDGPALLEVVVDELQSFEPKLSSKKLPDGKMVSAPLEDMFPFLDRSEFNKHMIIKPLPESLV